MGNNAELVMDAPEAQAPATDKPIAASPLSQFAWLPIEVALESPLLNFKVRDLLSLRVGTVVQASSSTAGSIPVLANGRRVASAHLEVSSNQLAARITELT